MTHSVGHQPVREEVRGERAVVVAPGVHLVAQVEGDVGLVTSSPDWDDPNAAHLSGLWVDRSARRCGAAQALSGAVVSHARDTGFRRVALWVASANAGADRLYAGLGFTRTGRTDTFQPPRDTYTEWKLELML